MSNVTKTCTACKREQPFSSFYAKSGLDAHTKPGHFTSECKECMKARSKRKPYIPRNPNTLVRSEALVIDQLRRNGIYAVTGKSVNAKHVDVVAWGCVQIEVKYSRLEKNGNRLAFVFDFSPPQRKRGVLAQVVVLVCDYGSGRVDYHVFDAANPIFYSNSQLKLKITFEPGRTQSRYHGHELLTQSIMDTHKNMWGVIASKFGNISAGLTRQYAAPKRTSFKQALTTQ